MDTGTKRLLIYTTNYLMTYVPNKFPTVSNSQYRIAICGEAPGQDEVSRGEPFVGASGRLLRGVLSQMGIQPDACFFGNVCQVRPPLNDIEQFQWQGEEIQHGLAQLTKDLAEFKPWLVLLLGKTALYAASRRVDIGNQRGSLFLCDLMDSPMSGYKCLSTYHPAACLRMYDWVPIFKFDLKRAAEEGRTHFLDLPKRDIRILKTFPDVRQWLDDCAPHVCGTDIEGYVYDLQCLGISPDPYHGGVIPFRGPNGDSFFQNEDEEIEVWQYLARYLTNPHAYKVWQNGLYDRFIFQYTYKIPVRGNLHDTMLEWHEWNPELPKGLDMQASILTREPFYKHERKSDSWDTKLIYCGKDSCITIEAHNKLTPRLNETSRTHYLFNRDLLNPLLYMELRGMAYKTADAVARRKAVLKEMYEAQYLLDKETQMGYEKKDTILCVQEVKALMCYVRDRSQVKKTYEEVYPRAMELAQQDVLSTAEQGELSTLLEKHCNVGSTKFTTFLYKTLNLPPIVNKKTRQPTANYEALLTLFKKTQSRVCELAITIRDRGTHAQMLSIFADSDGRIRCAYNSVGTNTGRLTSYSSPTGSGYNLQTIPKKDRDLFMADENHWFFQCDLSGADGWTVAAHCKYLGDPTMYDDYVFGLKPAKILCLMLRHGAGVSQKSREELKALSKQVSSEEWDYFACKIGQHGSSYLMGEKTMRDHIFIQSEGKLLLTDKEVHDLQSLFFIRYRGIKQWHAAIQRRLAKSPVLTAASGLTRRFFGRKDEILGEALAFEPQANTTYATNKAVLNLWNDPENRGRILDTVPRLNPREDILQRPLHTGDGEGVQKESGRADGERSTMESVRASDVSSHCVPSCSLKIEPLHQVHDAVLGQFKKQDTTWAINKIKQYFNNTLIIANQPIVIPFEGAFGDSWGNLNEGVI